MVFHENPAAQLFARTARHVRAKGADDLFKNLTAKLGKQLPAEGFQRAGMPSEIPGINVYRGPGGQIEGYAVAAIANRPIRAGERPYILPDIQTAQSVQKAVAKMLTPEEVGPVLKFWDEATQMLKGWVTKAFPAYHIRNRMSNRIQSWLDDVPVVGEHYKAANRIMAGQDVSIKIGTGQKLDREAIMRELVDEGVVRRGFYETEFAKNIGDEKASWNPFAMGRPNRFVQAGERASSALALAT